MQNYLLGDAARGAMFGPLKNKSYGTKHPRATAVSKVSAGGGPHPLQCRRTGRSPCSNRSCTRRSPRASPCTCAFDRSTASSAAVATTSACTVTKPLRRCGLSRSLQQVAAVVAAAWSRRSSSTRRCQDRHRWTSSAPCARRHCCRTRCRATPSPCSHTAKRAQVPMALLRLEGRGHRP
jgi:hypothetical protein